MNNADELQDTWRRIFQLRKSHWLRRRMKRLASRFARPFSCRTWYAHPVRVEYVNAGPSYWEIQAQREIDAELDRQPTI